MKKNDEVGYEAEEPTKALVEIDDWRVQEMYNMAPDAVMDELLDLSEEIRDGKSTWEEAKFELSQARERLKLMEAQVLQAALDSEDKAMSDQVGGKNAEVRQRKATIYLSQHPTVQGLAVEVKDLERDEVEARLAMEAILDRSKSLHQWARMFEAQVRLLATVRVPKTNLEELGQAIAQAYRRPVLDFSIEDDVVSEPVDTRHLYAPVGIRHLYAQIIRTFAREPESAIHPAISSVYDDARAWMQWWSTDAIGPSPVGTFSLVEKIVQIGRPIQALPDLEPVLTEEDIVAGKAAIDELFPPEVQIPLSLDVPEDEIDDVKAAIARHRADEPSEPARQTQWKGKMIRETLQSGREQTKAREAGGVEPSEPTL